MSSILKPMIMSIVATLFMLFGAWCMTDTGWYLYVNTLVVLIILGLLGLFTGLFIANYVWTLIYNYKRKLMDRRARK